METSSVQKTHPLIITAAVAVTAVSLAGLGAIFGVIPTPFAPKTAPTAVEAPVAAPTAIPPASESHATVSLPAGTSVKIEAPAEKAQPRESVARPQAKPARESTYAERPAPPRTSTAANSGQVRVANDDPQSIYVERAQPNDRPAARRAATCNDCATIVSVREVKKEGDASGVGAVAGGVLGGVVGNQVGKGHGKDAMTVLGALGGAYAGHQVEKSQRQTSVFEVTVRFDDGSSQVIKQTTAPTWHQGERVRVSGGQILAY